MAKNIAKKIVAFLRPSNLQKYFFDPREAWLVMVLLFLAEIVVNVLVINRIPCKYYVLTIIKENFHKNNVYNFKTLSAWNTICLHGHVQYIIVRFF